MFVRVVYNMADKRDKLTSKEILGNYLYQDFYKVASMTLVKKYFQKETRQQLNDQQTETLFKILADQHNKQSIKEIEKNLNNLQLIDMFQENANTSENLNEIEISNLITSLRSLDRSIESEISHLESLCGKELKSLEGIVDEFTDLKCCPINDNESIIELEKELKLLENKLLNEIEFN